MQHRWPHLTDSLQRQSARREPIHEWVPGQKRNRPGAGKRPCLESGLLCAPYVYAAQEMSVSILVLEAKGAND